MRWTFRLLAAVICLLIGYAGWPLLGLKRIADVIEARDGPAFAELIDINELKRSVAAQLVRAHLKITGRERRLSPLALNLAVQAGMAIADSYVVEIVKAEALIDLLKEARTETFAGGSVAGPEWSLPNLRNFRRLLSS